MARRRTPMETFSFRAPRDYIEAGKLAAEKRDEYLSDAFRDFLAKYARDEIRAARTAKPTEETEETDMISGTEMARRWPDIAANVVIKCERMGGDVDNAWAVLISAVGEDRARELVDAARAAKPTEETP